MRPDRRTPAAAREQSLASEALHLLVIDYRRLSSEQRARLSFSQEEQLEWLRAAAARGASLVVLASEQRLEIYSTRARLSGALRGVLESLAQRTARNPAIGGLRVVEKTELMAARHLLRRASGIEHDGDVARAIAPIHAAAMLAGSSTALGLTLSALFRAAGNVSRRVRLETALGNRGVAPELIAIEAPSVERIVEEELAAWQAQEAEALRAKADACEAAVARQGSFAPDEPTSITRLRASLRAEGKPHSQNADLRRPQAG